MTGQKYKEVLISESGLQFNDVARKLGVTSASFDSTCKSPDIKSSYIERAVANLGIPLEKFFTDAQILTREEKNDIIENLAEQNRMLIEQNHLLIKLVSHGKNC